MIRSCLSRRVCLADAFSAGALSGAIRSRVRTTIAGQPCRATYATQASTATAPTASVEEVAQTQTRQEAPWQKELNKELKLQRAVRKQLDSLDDDPWKIGQHVENQLARDLFDEALLLTQKVSKDVQVAVAWNHLIGYQLEKQQLRRALKLFNEVGFLCPLSFFPTGPLIDCISNAAREALETDRLLLCAAADEETRTVSKHVDLHCHFSRISQV